MPVFLLFALMLLVMLMRVYQPLGTKVAGKVDKIVSLSFPERALLQRVNVYCIGFVLLLMTLTGNISAPAEMLVILAAFSILALPLRFFVTNQGIGLGNVLYRPWSEFSAYRVEGRRIVLLGKEGVRPLSVPLLGDHQRELIPVLRRHLSEAKDGKAVSVRRRQAAS